MIDIERIKVDAEQFFKVSKWSHDWDHTLRVYNLAVHIWKIEWADMDIIRTAVLLHDMARHEQDMSSGKICHAEKGAVLSREYLETHDYPSDFIDKVVHAIWTHRFRKWNPPESLEGKILFDADKLDGIWAVWIGRSFLFAWEHHAKLHNPNPDLRPEAEYSDEDTAYREYIVTHSKIKDRLFTKEAKRIAESRHSFMEEFFKRLNREVEWDE
ncbi:MAG: hypothetical protein ACD_3C00006G0010 [uncultured bacterium (gcode 4)]|uniref:HD domain-containing protein n=1 Tax=uncultured bacterium (gcode 4) TaxID=1234023 RepID=K2G0Q3_9BACT|nr:MAG: hypothetical protein ACD_3C00006G0010 [uncultured bacterium (gcode 4)]